MSHDGANGTDYYDDFGSVCNGYWSSGGAKEMNNGDKLEQFIIDELKGVRRDVISLKIEIAKIQTRSSITGGIAGTIASGLIAIIVWVLQKKWPG